MASIDGESPFPLKPGIDYSRISYPMLAAVSGEVWENERLNISKKM